MQDKKQNDQGMNPVVTAVGVAGAVVAAGAAASMLSKEENQKKAMKFVHQTVKEGAQLVKEARSATEDLKGDLEDSGALDKAKELRKDAEKAVSKAKSR